MKILVADDEPDILESTEVLLRLEGHEVETVGDASEILARATTVQPDVLLQDVNMPGLDVTELVASLRSSAATRHIRVLLFTAATEAHLRSGKAVEADGIIHKPFDLEDIRAAFAAVEKKIEKNARPDESGRSGDEGEPLS